MAYLEIDGKEYKARTDFKFERYADEKYNMEEKGEKMGGLMSVYLNLLEYNNQYLLAFWDCALSYLKKDKPSRDKIEDALEKRIEEEGDAEPLFKEAFQVLDNSGFFRKQVQNIWKNMEAMGGTGKTKAEKEDNEKMVKMMKDRRKELTE